MHKAGFVSIIGRPNVGKSTLSNLLVGERMSIITNKPQTTRHRILGMVNGEDYQIIFSDTPGIIENPAYKMQENMNNFVATTFEDTDVMLFVNAMDETYKADDPIIERLKQIDIPLFLVLNKTDIAKETDVLLRIQWWSTQLDFKEYIPISAIKAFNTDKLIELIVKYLPESPPFYPKDQLTDRSERFFVSEIIREKILELYHQEIPYSCEVIVTSFKEGTNKKGKPIVRISADIFVMRATQKSILIGKGGEAIKRLGTNARKGIEAFLQQNVFLELHVKVKDNWRDDERSLKHFGY